MGSLKKGQVTHRLLPNNAFWLKKLSMDLMCHMTQTLSDHGCYQSYLFKRNRADDSVCEQCNRPVDEHTTFNCPQWDYHRKRINPFLNGRLSTPNDVSDLLWCLQDIEEQSVSIRVIFLRARTVFQSIVKDILTDKEEAGRHIRALHANMPWQ